MSVKRDSNIHLISGQDHMNANKEMLKMFSNITTLKNIVERTMKEMSQVQKQSLHFGQRGDVMYDLRAATPSTFTLQVVGSRAYGLGFSDSDYDVSFEIGHGFQNGPLYAEEEALIIIKDCLLKSEDFSVVGLRSRRIMFLKTQHRRTGLYCDISIDNKRSLGKENVLIARNYLSNYKIRFMATAVKLWARALDLFSEKKIDGRISCFGMLWLVLFSLMRTSPPIILPVVSMRRKDREHEDFYDGWDFSTRPSITCAVNSVSEMDLLHHFFRFYGTLNLELLADNIISPYLGVFVPKEHFISYNNLPVEYNDYKRLVDVEPSSQLNLNSALCIQDPIDHASNFVYFVKSEPLERLLKMCRKTDSKLISIR